MDFKPIRNKLRTFTLDSVTNELLIILKEFEKDERKQRFWHPLILLKWNLEFSDKKYKAKTANRTNIGKLLKQLDELEMSHNTFRIKKGQSITKTFTILAHQQFLYQEITWWDTFSRQLILFNDLKSKYCIKKSFERLTNLSISTFLNISYIIWVYSHQDELTKIPYYGYINDDIKSLLTTFYSKNELKSYLDLLTVSKDNIHEILNEDNRVLRNYNLQTFEPSLFTRKPYFLHNNKLLIPHKDILHHNFNYFLYEYLKQKDENFTTEFGLRLEKYVQLGLDESDQKYKTENELKKQIGLKENLVDFIISDKVFVEVKAIESKPYVSANPTDKILGNEFRKNLVKAYVKQMVNVAHNLKTQTEYFGIVITYKKLFLGTAQDIWNQFLKEETLKVWANNEHSIIPYSNLFVMDIYTWDKLMQVLKDNSNLTLETVLKKVRDNNSSEKTKKFHFSMHLDDYNFTNFDLKYLKEANERIVPEKASG
ncbi:hypothetical protein [Tenacibaculum piscium]|uniref:Uncharacterized protein n=1 Tax=Tenacibaculum piscium TaxID=1458515 RepID=A0A2H1YH15_9FLAO|nr:hypothetical protein [Tenacibaculum piscium]MBE7630504.1 hypothetical protein [Tenacibaculum piscium]SOS74768.1 conserved hypothetical protein [Tenacibaculum piscium]